MKLFFIKFWIVASLLFSLSVVQAQEDEAFSLWSIEPLVGYGLNVLKGSTVINSSASPSSINLAADHSGLAMGLRSTLNFGEGRFFVGIESTYFPSINIAKEGADAQLVHPSILALGSSGLVSSSALSGKMLRGGFLLGTRLPETSLRLWMGVQPLEQFSIKYNGTLVAPHDFEFSGTSWKVGAGYPLSRVFHLSFEYVSASYSSLSIKGPLRLPFREQGDGLKTLEMESMFFSLSAPIELL